MSRIAYIFLLINVLISCEEVIDLNLETSKERLVVNASLNWFRNFPTNEMQEGKDQSIQLNLTAGYYDDELKAANNAQVRVINTNTYEIFDFIEKGLSGVYYNSNFKPILTNTYKLEILYNNSVYTAESTLINTPVINKIEQIKGTFFKEDRIVLNVYYSDKVNEENFYFFNYTTSVSSKNELTIQNDRFSNGNEVYEQLGHSRNQEEEVKPGDVFYIQFFEISKPYYQYLNVLLEQIQNFGLFSVTPAEVKGNIINETSAEDYPYGYFRVSMGNIAEVEIIEKGK